MNGPTQTSTTTETVVPLTGEHPIARVDLMPPGVMEARRFKKSQGVMVAGVLVVVAGLTGGWFLAQADANRAADELAAEQARTAVLQAEAAQFAQVPAVLASVDRAESALATAMATDIEWSRYVSQIGQTAPSGVWFQSITVARLQPGALTTDPLAPTDAVAEITTTGRALTYPEVATWLDTLDGISTLDYALFSTATLDEASGADPWVDFVTSTKVTSGAYSDRYAQEGQ